MNGPIQVHFLLQNETAKRVRMKTLATVFIFLLNLQATLAFAEEMVDIPPGSFIMGHDGDPLAKPLRKYMLGGFAIDKFEVTNAQYGSRVKDHKFPTEYADHPVANVNWQEASDYCEALGKRLPTEAEWEKAARGDDGRTWPWGNKKLRRPAHPKISGVVTRKTGSNKKDVSPYKVFDMAGSLWEWTADKKDGHAVVRGGLWNLHLDFRYSKTWEKNRVPVNERFTFLGFRCAR